MVDQSNENAGGMFGMTKDVQSEGRVSFKGGIHRAIIAEVKKTKKKNKAETEEYVILEVVFKDLEGLASHSDLNFAISTSDGKFKSKLETFNKHLKHIFETFFPFPTNGIGLTAKNFEEYIDALVTAFNTSRDGKPIYMDKDGRHIPVWVKFVYDEKNYLKVPTFPNFIELDKGEAPKKLQIDLKNDKIKQTEKSSGGDVGGLPGISGGIEGTQAYNDFMS